MNIPGFIYITDRPKFSRVEKPNRDDYGYGGTGYIYDCVAWQEGLLDIVNVKKGVPLCEGEHPAIGEIFEGKYIFYQYPEALGITIASGQPCEAIPEGNKMRIVKLK